MIKRFSIAAVIVGLFLGGVAYFNLVFKPKMIGEFMAKMVPPPATVTAERPRPSAGSTRSAPSAR
jgi:membrane fusion protein (multidrug efflux system)